MIVSFNAYRGGNGKTTIAINVAYKLAMDNKVLLVDFDSRAPALQDYIWTLLRRDQKPRSILDYLFLEGVKPEECIGTIEANGVSFDTMFVAERHGITPRTLLMLQRGQWEIVSGEYIKLLNLFEHFSNRGYDYILIDASPGFDEYNLMLIASLSELILLTTRAHKADLEETILYNLLAYRRLCDEKKKTVPLTRQYVRMIINEELEKNFTNTLIEEILKSVRMPQATADIVKESILARIRFYEELRFDKSPSIFSIFNRDHPFVGDIEYIAKKISEMSRSKYNA